MDSFAMDICGQFERETVLSHPQLQLHRSEALGSFNLCCVKTTASTSPARQEFPSSGCEIPKELIFSAISTHCPEYQAKLDLLRRAVSLHVSESSASLNPTRLSTVESITPQRSGRSILSILVPYDSPSPDRAMTSSAALTSASSLEDRSVEDVTLFRDRHALSSRVTITSKGFPFTTLDAIPY